MAMELSYPEHEKKKKKESISNRGIRGAIEPS
jgi:hypothetical protein